MKSRIVFRRHLFLVGLGATLLLAGSAKAQEITNTQFDDGPYAVPFSQPLSDPDSSDSAPPAIPVLTETKALQAMALSDRPSIPDQPDAAHATVIERWITAILLVTIGIVVFFILVELSMLLELRRRRKRSLRSHSNARMATRTA